ncbi:hypothetical protein OAG1_07060 [Agarivorans sp. OAG1]|nr:hypothetical protein OAG1_07060 [Agarivorans sp. OAG1]
MKYIYARTSTKEQNVDQQAEHLLTLHGDAEVFKEKTSGKTLDRPILNKLTNKVSAGDIIIVLSVSRLGRNTEEMLAFI